jgi:hypothetical protein
MKRNLVFAGLLTLLLGVAAAAVAQDKGRLEITVERVATANTLAGPVVGAKCIVMHWTNPGLHPTLFQDRIATTDQSGMCSVDLAPGIYDVFLSASELTPRAYQASVKAGATSSFILKLSPAGSRFQPTQ